MQGRAYDAGGRAQFVVARIHRHNRPSQRLASGAGFVYLEDMDDRLQAWGLIIDL